MCAGIQRPGADQLLPSALDQPAAGQRRLPTHPEDRVTGLLDHRDRTTPGAHARHPHYLGATAEVRDQAHEPGVVHPGGRQHAGAAGRRDPCPRGDLLVLLQCGCGVLAGAADALLLPYLLPPPAAREAPPHVLHTARSAGHRLRGLHQIERRSGQLRHCPLLLRPLPVPLPFGATADAPPRPVLSVVVGLLLPGGRARHLEHAHVSPDRCAVLLHSQLGDLRLARVPRHHAGHSDCESGGARQDLRGGVEAERLVLARERNRNGSRRRRTLRSKAPRRDGLRSGSGRGPHRKSKG